MVRFKSLDLAPQLFGGPAIDNLSALSVLAKLFWLPTIRLFVRVLSFVIDGS